MKRFSNFLIYLVRAVVLGLALAFVLVILWPELRHASRPKVEIHETQAVVTPALPVGPASYAAAVDKAKPAVVNINTAKLVTVRPHPFFDDPVFREFFGRGGGRGDLITPQKRVETSLGSGVIISEQGYILTNNHVIQGADAIQVALQDGRTASAKVIGVDPDTDIAVLKIELKNLSIIALGRSEQMRVGDVVLAIGNPFGVGQTVTMGIVSATGRSKLGINTFENFIQTDAAINPGNSGGALIDTQGNLVGINTAIFSRSGGSQGIGFAIPTSLAKIVLQDIIQHGRPVRGWLGVEAHAITPNQAKTLNLKTTDGVIVEGVLRDGPAHRAGLQPGDIIQSIDGKKIHEAQEALLVISSHKPGTQVKLEVLRNGKRLMLEAIAVERPQRPPNLKG